MSQFMDCDHAHFFVDFFVDRLKTRNSSYLIIIHQLFFVINVAINLPDGMVGTCWKPMTKVLGDGNHGSNTIIDTLKVNSMVD